MTRIDEIRALFDAHDTLTPGQIMELTGYEKKQIANTVVALMEFGEVQSEISGRGFQGGATYRKAEPVKEPIRIESMRW